MKLVDYKNRVDGLIKLTDKAIKTKYDHEEIDGEFISYVDVELAQQIRVGGLSFLASAFTKKHIFYVDFEEKMTDASLYSVKQAKGILNAAKIEIDGGWLFELKGIVSAEIFNDFFEMASHLLSEGYKDPAAVMIGSTLEEHLRQLCTKHSIALSASHPTKTGISIPKKADVLNAELTKAKVYNNLDQKQVTAWLGLRNSAAHGNYADYTKEQVDAMHYGVMNFVTRVS